MQPTSAHLVVSIWSCPVVSGYEVVPPCRHATPACLKTETKQRNSRTNLNPRSWTPRFTYGILTMPAKKKKRLKTEYHQVAAPEVAAPSHAAPSADLPEELLRDIGSRLPLASILRARLVNKSWCSVLSTFVSCIVADTEKLAPKGPDTVIRWRSPSNDDLEDGAIPPSARPDPPLPGLTLLSTDAFPPQSIVPLLPLKSLLGHAKGTKAPPKGTKALQKGNASKPGSSRNSEVSQLPFPAAHRAVVRVHWCKGLHDPRRLDQLFETLTKRQVQHALVEVTCFKAEFGEDDENEKCMRNIFRTTIQKLSGLTSLTFEAPPAASTIVACIERDALWSLAKNMTDLTSLDIGSVNIPWFGLEAIMTLTKLTSLSISLLDDDEHDHGYQGPPHGQLQNLSHLTNLERLRVGGFEADEGLIAEDGAEDDFPKPLHCLLKCLPKLVDLRVPDCSIHLPENIRLQIQALTLEFLIPSDGAANPPSMCVELPQLTSLFTNTLSFFTGLEGESPTTVLCPKLMELEVAEYDASYPESLLPALSSLSSLTRLVIRGEREGLPVGFPEALEVDQPHDEGFSALLILTQLKELVYIPSEHVHLPSSYHFALASWTQLCRLDIFVTNYGERDCYSHEDDNPRYTYATWLPQLTHLRHLGVHVGGTVPFERSLRDLKGNCSRVLDALAPHLGSLRSLVWRATLLKAAASGVKAEPTAQDLNLIKLAKICPQLETLQLAVQTRTSTKGAVASLNLSRGGIPKALEQLRSLEVLSLRQVGTVGLSPPRSSNRGCDSVGDRRLILPVASRCFGDQGCWEDDYQTSPMEGSMLLFSGLTALSSLSQLSILEVGHTSAICDARLKLLHLNSKERLGLLTWAQERHLNSKDAGNQFDRQQTEASNLLDDYDSDGYDSFDSSDESSDGDSLDGEDGLNGYGFDVEEYSSGGEEEGEEAEAVPNPGRSTSPVALGGAQVRDVEDQTLCCRLSQAGSGPGPLPRPHGVRARGQDWAGGPYCTVEFELFEFDRTCIEHMAMPLCTSHVVHCQTEGEVQVRYFAI
eukprot:gene15940-22072_t